jgi:hypothetical protein
MQSLSLAKAANHGFKDDPSAEVRGWTAEGSELDLARLKPDAVDVSGVSFELLNPASNGGRSVIALRKADKDFVETATVSVGRKCDWMYVLNTGIWMERKASVGVLSIVYQDGAKEEVEFKEGTHMAHWQFARFDATHAKRVMLTNVASTSEGWACLYATPIENPHPEKTVEALAFRAVDAREHKPIWLILAVTVRTGDCIMNPRSVAISLKPSQASGRIRRLNGTNLGPPLLFEGIGLDITEDLKPLEIPLMRLHDASWENGNMKLVDIPHVFPLFHLDPADPRNYCFAQTDDYIQKCLETGAKILYRLGVSIEHTKHKYFTNPPEDFAKWSEICCRIIAHYNEGWANGFHHNIEYWEIWNEANAGPAMWKGTWDEYVRLYVTASKMIKARFPNVKVGGPVLSSPTCKENIESFLDACRKENAPLDFFSWHQYAARPEHIVVNVEVIKRHLNAYGFAATELHLNEWNYLRARDRIDGAAFANAVLIGLQDTPLDMSNFYTGTVLFGYGIFSADVRIGQALGKNKSYYALRAFALLAKYEDRIFAGADRPDAVSVLAGRKRDGSFAALIACFQNRVREIVVDFGGIVPKTARALVLDETRNLDAAEVRIDGSCLALSKEGASAVFFVEMT